MRGALWAAMASLAAPVFGAEGLLGCYRQPALHGDTVVFNAEGDLWKVAATGGTAQRLTTHLERERFPVISPDGSTIAFTASYEGPTEIYLMAVAGGQPRRLTYEGVSDSRAPYPVAWKSKDEIVYATWYFARRDTFQLAVVEIESGDREVIPLEQACDGALSADGGTLFFTRLPRQNSFAKRYHGGLVENLWRYRFGSEKAEPITGSTTSRLTARCRFRSGWPPTLIRNASAGSTTRFAISRATPCLTMGRKWR